MHNTNKGLFFQHMPRTCSEQTAIYIPIMYGSANTEIECALLDDSDLDNDQEGEIDCSPEEETEYYWSDIEFDDQDRINFIASEY